MREQLFPRGVALVRRAVLGPPRHHRCFEVDTDATTVDPGWRAAGSVLTVGGRSVVVLRDVREPLGSRPLEPRVDRDERHDRQHGEPPLRAYAGGLFPG